MRTSFRLLAFAFILAVGSGVASAHDQTIWGRQSDLSSVSGL